MVPSQTNTKSLTPPTAPERITVSQEAMKTSVAGRGGRAADTHQPLQHHLMDSSSQSMEGVRMEGSGGVCVGGGGSSALCRTLSNSDHSGAFRTEAKHSEDFLSLTLYCQVVCFTQSHNINTLQQRNEDEGGSLATHQFSH